MKPYIIPFEQLKNKDVELVGGKNASIGEMISGLANLGVSVPGGFATTSHAYRDFLAQDGLDARIRDALADLDVEDVERLAVVGAQIRGWMLATPFPQRLAPGTSRLLAQDGRSQRRRAGIRRRRALLRHRRRSAGSILCRAAGNLPERARRGASDGLRA